jgi:hypothetical protein
MSLFGKKDSAETGTGGEVKSRSKVGKRSYGIAETTLLMRTLPVDQNVELVVRVVRNTLESMDVQLPDIIEDAQLRESSLQERMQTLNSEIAEFTAQIDLRRQEIGRLQEELTETTTVKERLLLAQKLAGQTPVAAADSAAAPLLPPLPNRVNGKNLIEVRELAR